VRRAAYLRQLLHEPPKRPDVATRLEALHLLSQSARDGRVQAQVALARELREADGEEIFDWVMEAGWLRCRTPLQWRSSSPTGLAADVGAVPDVPI
jgi:hypothetical protein